MEVAPNACGCESGIISRSMKCVWLGSGEISKDLTSGHSWEKWIIRATWRERCQIKADKMFKE